MFSNFLFMSKYQPLGIVAAKTLEFLAQLFHVIYILQELFCSHMGDLVSQARYFLNQIELALGYKS